jgi:hypothetical protein
VGDVVNVPYFGGRLSFWVKAISSERKRDAQVVLVTQRTQFAIVESHELPITIRVSEYIKQEAEFDIASVGAPPVENAPNASPFSWA